MDPAGSWAYTYNRIGVSGVSTTLPTTSSSDFNQHNLTTVAGQGVAGTSPTPSTILLHTSNTIGNSGSSYTSGGFISSSPGSYEPVFNSIFQQTAPKSAQYNSPVNPNRQNLNAVQVTVSATEKTESPRQNFSNHGQQQPNFYTEQSTSGTSSPTTNLASGARLTWQGGNASHITIGDPFSLLSQENIVQTGSPDSSGNQNTYTSQYQTPQIHLNQVKISRRSISPQISGTKGTIQPVPSPITTVSVDSSGVQTHTQYYRHPTSISSTYSDSSAQTGIIANTSKSYSGINQTCLLVSSAMPSASNQNVTNQKYTKKQNMYNNAGRNNIAKNSSIAATITPSNMVANLTNNNGNNHSFGIPTSAVKTNNQTLHLGQSKAQTKIYPELLFVEEQGKTKLAEIQQTDSQDSSISYYTIIDGRLAYSSGNTNLIINESPKGKSVSNVQSPRQFILSNSADIIASDGSRIKTEPNYAISPFQSECTNAIIVPRKQSPSHSTSSQTASPAYPIYNSPMNSIESPSQHSASSCATHSSSDNSGHLVIYKPNNTNQAQIATPTIDAPSVTPRNVSNNTLTNTSGPVVYSSVITRALVKDQGKVYSSQQTCWDTDIKPKKFYTINSGSQNEIVVPAEIQLKSAYYENTSNNMHIGALHGLKTEEAQITENILVTTDNPLAAQIQITPKIEEIPQPPPPPPKSRRRRTQNSTKTREQLLSENEFLINRVPPRTKNTKKNSVANENSGTLSIVQTKSTQSISQHQQNGGTYYDDNWNAHQGVTQQVVFTGSSTTPHQIANYGEHQQLQQQYQHTPHLQQQQTQSLQGQQQLQLHQHQSQQHQQQQQQQQHQQQHQQFQQPQQQVLLTHQSSHHVQYPAQNPYYNSYEISSNVSGPLIQNQNSGTTEAPINLPEPYKTATIVPKQEIIIENTPNPSNSEAGNNDTNPDKQESNREEEHGLKVVVPNIEEELDFLCSGAVESGKIIKEKKALGVTPILKSSPQACEPFKGKTFKVPNSAATGFMASYLKFLQGDRDSSPPPIGKPQRNPIFQKTIQPIQTNSSMLQSQTQKSSSQTITSLGKAINEIIKKSSTTVVSLADSVISTSNLSQHFSVVSPHQQTSVICQELSSKSVGTVTTSFASTQTINKKRKAISAEYNKEQNKQRKGNKVKDVSEIAVQTASHPVMLPKKARPQMAMQMASMQMQNKPTNVVPLVNQQLPPASMIENQDQLIIVNKLLDHAAKKVPPTHRYQQSGEEDPLNLPPRRETSLRKAKTRGIEEIMQKKGDNEDHEEPLEFADSDTDPVWTPEDEENEINKTGKLTKRKCKRPKISYSRSRKPCSNILTAAVMDAGIDDSDVDNALHDVNKRIDETQGNTRKQINSPKCMKQEAIKTQEYSPALLNTNNTTSIVEAYRTGDFVILRSDLLKDWPVLWQVDGKSILQMFEPFPKEGKVLYKNMSKYAAWSNESKRLYVRAPITIQSQSQNEIVVELKKSELYGNEAEQYAQKLMIDYLAYRENFDVYVQTLISQSLDQNFFTEITKEKDEYFLSNIKIIEDIMENCARKLLQITHIAKDVIVSIKIWPHYNSIADIRHSSLNQTFCVGCNHSEATMRFLLYGQPYKSTTMQPMEMDETIKYESDIMFCQSCESRAKLLHKIVHEKYNLYQICSRKVQDQQIIDPEKGTTAILNDLLADNDWIDQLFSNVRSSWVEVESIQRIVRFYQVSQ